MIWAIVLIVASAVLLVLAGIAFAQKADPGVGWLPLIVGAISLLAGAQILYNSGTGNICDPGYMPDQIYTVSGQIATSGGAVAVIEDSKQHVYAVWTEKKKDNCPPPLSPNTKIVKIGGERNNKCLMPVEDPTGTQNLLTPAEKPAEPAKPAESPASK